ncbi:putative chromatin modification-related protein [Lyophyllum shimeji]|uniref:Chromatin modification-related protein n=1 Tax=Lyophyllum shimeji TaxID=47721 RepID=A0A9P3PG56_LYOSH|nr:putative chromatin modification-related protein [Lyophyllum shimeji]
MNGSVQNLEEAANIASEFIYSLDNLPHEVNHILQEIRVKEVRAQELQQDIDKDAAKYIRHSVRASTSVPSSPSSRAPSPKSTALPGKIDAAYAEINQLSAEKCALAQTLVDLITRTRARLDSDLAKVRILQGETVDYASALGSSLSAVPGLGMAGFSDKMATAQLSDSLRSALTSTPTIPDLRQTPVPASSSSLTVAAGPAQKKRRVAASSIKLASASPIKHRSASPTTTAPLTTTQRVTSRLSRQSITRQEAEADMDEGDEDAEGEDAEADDERLYCFCQKQSYGDMIACDNEGDCPFEWFHLSCVGMKQPTPEKWYCSVCLQNMAGNTKKTPAPAVGRKGRKK